MLQERRISSFNHNVIQPGSVTLDVVLVEHYGDGKYRDLEILRKHPGGGCSHVAGARSVAYVIRVRNGNRFDIMVKPSVDGLSAMDGKPAGTECDDGYVISACATGDIPGWRINDKSVANFAFGSIPASYAELIQEPQNIGVIGLAAWARKFEPPPVALHQDFLLSGGGATRSMSFGPPQEQGLGTVFGDQIEHRVTRVKFNPEDAANPMVLMVRYDSYENLVAKGIIAPHSCAPDPFPASRQQGCVPPPGWNE